MSVVPSFDAECFLRVVESARQVRRRYQFYVWSQSYLRSILPFDVCICGAYQRGSRAMAFESFHSLLLPPSLLDVLIDPQSSLMQRLIDVWLEQRGNSAIVGLDESGVRSAAGGAELLEAGIEHLLMHGVSRPQRPAELESLFLFASFDRGWNEQDRENLELLLPQLHSTYLRVFTVERELVRAPALPVARTPEGQSPITQRERQILGWVREGKSNQEISEQLTISALTVKNHVQKILRKLGAANRAQAVAKAMTLNLIERSGPVASPFGSSADELDA